MEEAMATTQPNLTSSLPTQTQAPTPSTAAESQPSKPSKLPPPADSLTPNSKNRPLENAISQSSHYCKMRAVIQGLRHHFLEVLQSPDFRNCRASCDIQTELKVLIDICKHIKTEMIPQKKNSNVTGDQHLSSESQEECTKKAKHEHDPQVDRQSENNPTQPISNLDREQADDMEDHGSYMVGGSAFGWNFITFRSIKEAVYYGVTKEQFRADARI